MFRSRSWFGSGLWKPKNPHSLEHLKYLYNVLSKNQVVSENNRGLLVETLRSIAEILIWGDQNDSSVFDFFLEKNMLSFFLKIMKQKCGSYVCVQLLQTLNILFENIRNETSLYYLLSNNHVNSIIVHKFDFSDEEVMAYYISFLKTLSLKLNTHTIHFFYNEHTNDFPLYTEAIKFFNHQESMVRIAVRTLTLNVYRVDDKSMLKFIGDKTAAPYFSNLVWFIGSHVLELDSCVRNDADHQSQNRLSDLVAEHLDHLHYLNDILCLEIGDLNEVLTDHLLNKLLIPLYVYSLTKRRRHSQLEDTKPHVSSVVSLFLLSQVFLIITHVPLVHVLAWIILNGDMNIFSEGASEKLASYRQGAASSKPGFAPPTETLEKSLETKINSASVVMASDTGAEVHEIMDTHPHSPDGAFEDDPNSRLTQEDSSLAAPLEVFPPEKRVSGSDIGSLVPPAPNTNITDEEKEQRLALESGSGSVSSIAPPENISPIPIAQVSSLANKPFLEAVFNALQCSENDYVALFALCLLYALGHNQGVNEELLDSVLFPSVKPETKHWYNVLLVERLIKIISLSCQPNCRIRLVTLELTIRLLIQLVTKNGLSYLHDCHLAIIEGAKEESTALLRNFYKSEEIFLDMFEDEYNEMKKRPLNVEWLMMDSNILLPPTGTPMTGIEFSKRLPCGEVERARRAIRVFFLIRELSLTLRKEPETQLPLTNPNSYVPVNEVLDLNNSDLIACIVVTKDNQKIRRFLATDSIQLILVEPDTRRLGWGIAKFVGLLQDVEVTADKEDSRYLHITVHRPLSSGSTSRVPLLSAKFIFDDHIRCMAAKQRLTKGRAKARQKKMNMIAKLLDLPNVMQPSTSPPTSLHSLHAFRHENFLRGPAGSGRLSRDLPPSGFMQHSPHLLHHHHYHHRPLFTVNRVPGFATAMRRGGEATPGVPSSLPPLIPILDGTPSVSALSHLRAESLDRQQGSARSRSQTPVNGGNGTGSNGANGGSPGGNGSCVGVPVGGTRSRDGSPRPPRPRSEEIPLEDMSLPPSPSTVCSSGAPPSGSAQCKHKPRSAANLQSSCPTPSRRRSNNSPGLGVAVIEVSNNRIHCRRPSSHPCPLNRKSPPSSSRTTHMSSSLTPSPSATTPSSPSTTPSRTIAISNSDGPSTSGASAPASPSPSIPKPPSKIAETETSFMEMPLGIRSPDVNGNPPQVESPENVERESRARPLERALLHAVAGRPHLHQRGEPGRRKLRRKGVVETV